MMKFFYTRKDVDEEIAKALAEAARREEEFKRRENMQQQIWRLSEELHDLRIRLDPEYMKKPTTYCSPANMEARTVGA